MTPIFFGPAERQLFALYHSPQRETANPTALLMCYPFGHEANRIHRLYRVVAERLARQGVAVLRFDYFGAGDSAGDDVHGEMKGWRGDILRAHEELRRRSGARQLSWLGARLGATLAIQGAREATGLKRLVLWDPIVDGPSYVEELRVAHLAMLKLGFYGSVPTSYSRGSKRPGQAPAEALGHQISTELAVQLLELRADQLVLPKALVTTVFSTPQDDRAKDWCSRENAGGHQVVHETLAHPIIWTSEPLPNHAIVPGDITRRLVEVLR